MAITQAELKELLHYDQYTGVFTWLCNKRKPNSLGYAGTIAHRKGKKYMQICINFKKYYSHRLAWFYTNKEWPENEIDHIDGNGLNNKINNLRPVTRAENTKNTRKYNTNKSGLTGVCWDKRESKWKSYINIDGVLKNIGYFDNIFDAACSRKSASIKYEFHKNHGSNRPL